MDGQTNIFIDISRNLGEINAKLGHLCETIAKHEMRISQLEHGIGGAPQDWRSDVIRLLAKAVIVGGVSIASLAGGGTLLMKIAGG